VREGLKQRLVGAFVLAALAVIFLPGLFKEQQAHRVDSESRIPLSPPPQAITFSEPDSSWDGENAPDPETMFLPDESSQSVTSLEVAAISSVQASSIASVSSSVRASSSSAAPVPVVSLNEKGIPEAWVVQLVSLSNKQAAEKLRNELQADGYKAFIREASTANGTFSRVFVGPTLDRADAMKVKAALDQRLKINAQVYRFEP